MLRRLIDAPWTYYTLALVLVVVAVLTQFELRVPSRPVGDVASLEELRTRDDVNVLFVLIDTLRADRLSAYGYERETSPVLADLASSGVRFSHVEAQSTWTKCSMASLWTSLYPMRTGITRVEDVIGSEVELPAKRLREAGFRTAGIWRNGWVANNFGFDQGFELYLRPHPGRETAKIRRARRNPGVAQLMGTDEDITETALYFLEEHSDERFFLYLHYMDVHQYVFDQTAADLGYGTRLTDSYDASIHWVDRNIGKVLLGLDERGLLENTIVVVASDHGEGFEEHGEGHAQTLYREVTEVPWILGLPFRVPDGVVIDEVVRNVDIWPTLYGLLGMDPPKFSDGRSLVPLIVAGMNGESPPAEAVPTEALAYLDRTWGQRGKDPLPLVSIRSDDKRLLLPAWKPENLELYDTVQDPTEQRNVASERPEVVARLKAVLEPTLDQEPPWGETPQVELDDFYRKQLEALGYIIQ